MDKVALLEAFSRRFVPGTVKVETERCGFPFLDELLTGGAALEYGELTPTRLLHKYKLTNVSEERMRELLADHVAKTGNVCRYFGAVENDVFAINLDNNHKTNDTAPIPEMGLAVRAFERVWRELGVTPLIVASGRGYHVWGRLDGPVANERLYEFMVRAAVRAMGAFHGTGYDHHTVKLNFYPDLRAHNVVSLRLFGSEHAKNKVFSNVWTPEGLLSEEESWAYFEDFVRSGAISPETLGAAIEALRSDGTS